MRKRELTYDDKVVGRRRIPCKVFGEQPIRHSQEGEGKNQGQEDDDEADIRAECADKEYERHNSHEDQEEAYSEAKMCQHCQHEHFDSTRAGDNSNSGDLPNPALNACVVRPTEASCPAGANDENAAKDGLRVPPSDKKNAPNVQKTTEGKVFPSTNSRSPVVNWSRPPKKKNCGLEGVNITNSSTRSELADTYMPFAPLLAAPRHCIRSHDKGVKASKNPTRPLLHGGD